MLYPWGVVADW